MMKRQQPIRPHTIAIAGANGMVGRHLVEALLARGDRVIALVRSPESHSFPPSVDVRRWRASDPLAPVDEADAVVNLVGDPIFAQRWTQTRKQELIHTRVLATRSLVEGIRQAGGQGRTFISSTAIEYAGDTGDRQVGERAAAGKGFLAELSRLWEAEAQRVSETGARLVLGREGGVLAGLLPLYRSGFGGTLGPGGQWVSWIHVNDAARLILHAFDHETITGPLISASPHPVTSREFARMFAHAVRRPRLFPMSKRMMELLWGERAACFSIATAWCRNLPSPPDFSFAFLRWRWPWQTCLERVRCLLRSS
jgi:uncharacterized protein